MPGDPAMFHCSEHDDCSAQMQQQLQLQVLSNVLVVIVDC